MRIIYKNEGVNPNISPRPQIGKAQKESVLVITTGKKSDLSTDNALLLSQEDYDVKISKEAVARNLEVRAHEKSHIASLGSAAASDIIYDTVRGPNGENIAIGGKIAVDISEIPGDPMGTLRKARTIISAANSPNSPSMGDMKTAANAYRLARVAQEQLNQEKTRNFDLLA